MQKASERVQHCLSVDLSQPDNKQKRRKCHHPAQTVVNNNSPGRTRRRSSRREEEGKGKEGKDVYPADPDSDLAREARLVILVRSTNFQMHFRLQRLLNQARYLKSAQKVARKRKRERGRQQQSGHFGKV